MPSIKSSNSPFLGVEEGLGEGVVLDLEGGDLLVLVGRDGDELCLWEAEGQDGLLLCAGVHLDHVQAGLVLVEGVEHDLGEEVGSLINCVT